MVIAWTYLLHAYYRANGIDYKYYEIVNNRKHYKRNPDGSIRHWELHTCLEQVTCPIDNEAKKNLQFLIGLRNEIEHRMSSDLDNYLSGRYQACVINFNGYIKQLFGTEYSLDSFITYSLQLIGITEEQLQKPKEPDLPPNLLSYIAKFDTTLTEQELSHPHFSYKLLFTRKVVNRSGQADRVVEFIPPNTEIANAMNKEFALIKEVEKPKFRATDVVNEVNKAGFSKFSVTKEHIRMWQAEDAKNPGKGFGTSVAGYWYWYESWVKRCIDLCQAAGDEYK
jgi:hypothetical protein